MLYSADDFDEDALFAAAVEFGVEDLLPRDRSPVCLSVTATTTSRPNTWRLTWASPLSSPVRWCRYAWVDAVVAEPDLFDKVVEVLDQARLVIVDEDAGRDVHGIDQHQALLDAALEQALLHLGSDVQIVPGGVGCRTANIPRYDFMPAGYVPRRRLSLPHRRYRNPIRRPERGGVSQRPGPARDGRRRGAQPPLQKKIRSLQELLDISRRAQSQASDLRTILKDLVHTSCTVLKAESASLLLLDEKSPASWSFKVVSDGGMAARLEGLRLAPGEGIAGQVAATGTRRIVTNVDKDPDHCGRFDSISGLATRSVMAVPLAWRGQIYGVLELVNLTPYVRAEDVDHVETVASIAAQAVANAELMDTLRQNPGRSWYRPVNFRIHRDHWQPAWPMRLNQPLTGMSGLSPSCSCANCASWRWSRRRSLQD